MKRMKEESSKAEEMKSRNQWKEQRKGLEAADK